MDSPLSACTILEYVKEKATLKGFAMFEEATIGDLPDFRFGHAHDIEAGTGCTVFIAPNGAVCGADISGGGPATRETDLLRPENMVDRIHAVIISGGSAFGLEASCGVMKALAGRSIGFPMAGATIPIVCGACLFDLLVGKDSWPDGPMGIAAVEAAFGAAAFEQGNVGAGTGASVGKVRGPSQATKTGFGFQIARFEDLVVGAFVAVNAIGNIKDPEGGWLAGCRDASGRICDAALAFADTADMPDGAEQASGGPTANTTLGVVVTNAELSKAQATKVSQTVNDAYARAIKPVHTSHDGDAVFTMASGEVEAPPDLVAIIATEAMEEAIYRAARHAVSAYGLPAARDIRPTSSQAFAE